MEQINILKRFQDAMEVYQTLVHSPIYTFEQLKPSTVEDGLAGVYVISHRKTGEVLYVGRTKNLRRRLYTNHLMGPTTNARLKKYLVEDKNEPQIEDIEDAKRYLRENCQFQYLVEPDYRRRGQLEGLFSYLLHVRYIDEEH